jgi:hypothetical protein
MRSFSNRWDSNTDGEALRLYYRSVPAISFENQIPQSNGVTGTGVSSYI